MKKKGIFVAATGQHVGKTTVCLGLFAALKNLYSSVGFLKPVGQEHVSISPGVFVDKDILLFKEHFALGTNYTLMSPFICSSGFTREYLDGSISQEKLEENILHSYKTMCDQHDFVLVEGTGHTGVGSLFNLNNAQVAKMLGLDMVLIAKGGLGSTFDTLALNIFLCEKYGVTIKGIILNKVLLEKQEMLAEYFPKTLQGLNIPILGYIPFNELLSTPSVMDFEMLFNTTLLSGQEHRYRHFSTIRLIADSLQSFLEEFHPEQLTITPACREDIIMATIERKTRSLMTKKTPFQGGMILTGQKPPKEKLLDFIVKSDIPILYTPLSSFSTMKMIGAHTAKIDRNDTSKIEQAIQLIQENVSFSLFL